MIEKNVYFVRHGECEDNKKPVFQSPDSPLSERGKEQANRISERAAHLNFEQLISSPLLRAKQTAFLIGEKTKKETIYSALFVERIKPTIINGKSHYDEEAAELADKWNQSLFTSGLRVEDGENFDDIISRADKALDFLTNQDGKELLVVTHGFFLRTMIARVLLGLSLTEKNLKNFQSAANMKNTGLSVLQYGRWQEEKPLWRLWIYNDHSHLG